jgi:hypothetical protein
MTLATILLILFFFLLFKISRNTGKRRFARGIFIAKCPACLTLISDSVVVCPQCTTPLRRRGGVWRKLEID